MLQLIREANGATRADFVGPTGLARSTVAQRLEQLSAHGLLREPARTTPPADGRR